MLGGVTLDGDHRIHVNGQGVGAMCLLGTFAEYVVAPTDSAIKIDKAIPLDKAALLGCGVPTGWGSSVYAAETQIGDTVVVVGVGGVGINAVQGARFAGASQIVAVDPVEFKREKAPEFGATHTAASLEEALPLVESITDGRLADRSIMTMGVLDTQLMAGMEALTRKGGTMVNTAAPPAEELNMSMSMFSLTMFGKRLQGALFGNCAPRKDVPMLLDLYMRGDLMLDELVTRTYKLEEINQGIEDMREGRNLRGLIVYED